MALSSLAPQVFVSHSHEDDEITLRLVQDLHAAGADVWVDTINIEQENFSDLIHDALASREWLIVVQTPTALQATAVRAEVDAALDLIRKGAMKGIVSFLAVPCDLSDTPTSWGALPTCDATMDYHDALASLEETIGLREPTRSAALGDAKMPLTATLSPSQLLEQQAPTLPVGPQLYATQPTTPPQLSHRKRMSRRAFLAGASALALVGAASGVVAHTVYSSRDTRPPARLRWRYTTDGPIESSPRIDNGIVYVGSQSHVIFALQASDGTPVWSYRVGGAITSSPCIAQGVVYFGSADSNVYALDAQHGSLLWSASTYRAVTASAAADGDSVYIGSNDGYLYCFDASTGHRRWRYPTHSLIESSPCVSNGLVYVGSEDSFVYALDTQTGKLVWKYATGSFVVSSPTIVNGVLYIGSLDNNIYALDAQTGKLVWKYDTGSRIRSSPTVSGDTVYFGSYDHSVYALNTSDGSLAWRYLTGDLVFGSPAISNGTLYIGSADSRVYALDAETGALIWKYQLGKAVYSSPAVVGDTLYIGSDDGYLYALSLS